MDLYRVTMPDGSTLDEYCGSDNEAILEGTKANHGVNREQSRALCWRRNARSDEIAEWRVSRNRPKAPRL